MTDIKAHLKAIIADPSFAAGVAKLLELKANRAAYEAEQARVMTEFAPRLAEIEQQTGKRGWAALNEVFKAARVSMPEGAYLTVAELLQSEGVTDAHDGIGNGPE
jgi:hypothetical protein